MCKCSPKRMERSKCIVDCIPNYLRFLCSFIFCFHSKLVSIRQKHNRIASNNTHSCRASGWLYSVSFFFFFDFVVKYFLLSPLNLVDDFDERRDFLQPFTDLDSRILFFVSFIFSTQLE